MRALRLISFALILAMVSVSCSKKDEPVRNPEIPVEQADQESDQESDPESDPESGTTPEKETPAQNGSGETNGYKLVWEDLFDGTSLDKSVWNIEVNGDGGGNNELQFYREKNISVGLEKESNRNCLIITAKKESYGGKSVTSGRLNTQGKAAWKHGKVEAMIKLPKTYQGLWPAFWMMGDDYSSVGWPACGELDILEMGHAKGLYNEDKSTKYLNGACHWGPAWNYHYSYGPSLIYDYNVQDGFHLFTVIWDEKAVNCYVDLDKNPSAKPYFSIDIEKVDLSDDKVCGNYFHKPFFIIFNLAVGGDFPGIHNIGGVTALNAANNYEAKMYVDYVRVYQKQ